MSESTDSELVERARAGDLEAFGDLMRRHHARVAGLCSNLLDNRAEVDDAAQEVFIKAYRSLDDFQGASRFTTWLYRITMNHCIDARRRAARRGVLSLDAIVESSGETATGLLPQPVEDSGQTVEASLMQDLLNGLPDTYREVLALRIDDLSYEDIASTLGCSLDAVKARLRRARRLLAETMRHLGETTSSKQVKEPGEPHDA